MTSLYPFMWCQKLISFQLKLTFSWTQQMDFGSETRVLLPSVNFRFFKCFSFFFKSFKETSLRKTQDVFLVFLIQNFERNLCNSAKIRRQTCRESSYTPSNNIFISAVLRLFNTRDSDQIQIYVLYCTSK